MERFLLLKSLILVCACALRCSNAACVCNETTTALPTTTAPSTTTSSQTPSLPYPLLVGAFNAKTLGESKMSDPFLADIIAQIVLRYDIILVQEIRDQDESSVYDLLRLVNETAHYEVIISAPLGRSTYKEQYAYFWRPDRLTLIDYLQFDDSDDDFFMREPFSVRVRPVGEGVTWDIGLLGIHTQPTNAEFEIEKLIVAFDDLNATWADVQDFILLGDFNADNYVGVEDLLPMDIYDQTRFHWLINFTEDTTTSANNDYTYDRVVVAGPNIYSTVVAGSAGIYDFGVDLDLTYDELLDVSDHYPVEVQLA